MRNRKKKTNRGEVSKEVMDQAADLYLKGTLSCRASAKQFGIDNNTLLRYCKKRKAYEECLTEGNQSEPSPTIGYSKTGQVFSNAESQELAEYLDVACKCFYGLTPKEVRKLAFQFALRNSIKFPPSWETNSMAGPDWFSNFMKKHPQLSIRIPEATSLARATAFNEANVKKFFDNLSDIMDRFHFCPEDIYNCDETGLTTVQKPNKVVAAKGTRQVGVMTSAERGQLVTALCAVNAIGNSVPPMIIFPRVNYREHFVKDGPTGCIGGANKSGWMNEDNFFIFIKHFVRYAHPTIKKRVLLILDNHESHISVKTLDYSKTNGVCILSLPPHCSHKLQPLDRAVYGPLKRYYNSAVDSWMKSNTRPMTIYDIPGLFNQAYCLAFTPSNIRSGFSGCGIYPFNNDIFSPDEFLPSSVTDRPNPEEQNHNNNDDGINAGPSNIDVIQTTSYTHVSPEMIRPLPKASPRKTKRRGGRKRRETKILTDSPNLKEVKEQKAKKMRQTGPKFARKSILFDATRAKQIRIEENASSGDEHEFGTSTDEVEDDDHIQEQTEDIEPGNFVLVKFKTLAKSLQYSVGKVIETNSSDTKTHFMKRSTKCSDRHVQFLYRDEEPEFHKTDNIVMKLPPARQVGGTKRCSKMYVFACDLSYYKPN